MNAFALIALSAFAGFQLVGAGGGIVTIVMRRHIFGTNVVAQEQEREQELNSVPSAS
jgi:hypothetical protein